MVDKTRDEFATEEAESTKKSLSNKGKKESDRNESFASFYVESD